MVTPSEPFSFFSGSQAVPGGSFPLAFGASGSCMLKFIQQMSEVIKERKTRTTLKGIAPVV